MMIITFIQEKDSIIFWISLSGIPVTSVIYPVPSEKGKGVLLVPTIHGNVLLGPNSEFVEDKGDVSCDEQLDQVSEQVHRLMPNLPMMNVIRSFAGCRPVGIFMLL